MCCENVAASLLMHISLLLTVYGAAGCGLSGALHWYGGRSETVSGLRSELPLVTQVALVALPALSVLLLLLNHLAASALFAAAKRRTLLYTYAAGMIALLIAEVTWVTWTWFNISERMHQNNEYMHAQHYVHSEPLPTIVYVSLGAATLLVLLQLFATALAFAASPGRAKRGSQDSLRTALLY